MPTPAREHPSIQHDGCVLVMVYAGTVCIGMHTHCVVPTASVTWMVLSDCHSRMQRARPPRAAGTTPLHICRPQIRRATRAGQLTSRKVTRGNSLDPLPCRRASKLGCVEQITIAIALVCTWECLFWVGVDAQVLRRPVAVSLGHDVASIIEAPTTVWAAATTDHHRAVAPRRLAGAARHVSIMNMVQSWGSRGSAGFVFLGKEGPVRARERQRRAPDNNLAPLRRVELVLSPPARLAVRRLSHPLPGRLEGTSDSHHRPRDSSGGPQRARCRAGDARPGMTGGPIACTYNGRKRPVMHQVSGKAERQAVGGQKRARTRLPGSVRSFDRGHR